MRRMWIAVGFMVLAVPGLADAGDYRLRGIVVDAKGKGVAGVTVASEWLFDAHGGPPTPKRGVVTKRGGRFSLPADRPG